MIPHMIESKTIGTTTNLSKFKNISPIGLTYSWSNLREVTSVFKKKVLSSGPSATQSSPKIIPIISPIKILIESGIFFFSIIDLQNLIKYG